jgi:DNA-binding transcriptional ArsR family regulator
MDKDKASFNSSLEGEENPNEDRVEQADDIRNLLNLVTQETRYVLIQNIVAHPREMPSLKELAYGNPSKSRSTIRNHLDKLIEADVVETVHLPKDERKRDLPHRFFRLTDSGRDFVERHDLLRAEETLKEMHSMLEKTPQIERYVDAPRPGDFDDDDDEGKADDSRRRVAP